MTDHRAVIENDRDTARRLAAFQIALDRTGLRIQPADGSHPFVQFDAVREVVALADWILAGTSGSPVEAVVGEFTLPPNTDPQALARSIVDAAYGRPPAAVTDYRAALDDLASAVQDFLGTGPLGVGVRGSRFDPQYRAELGTNLDRHADLDDALHSALAALNTAPYTPKD